MKVGLIGDSLTEGRPGVSFPNLLQDKYPQIIFSNLGNPGETIKSLHTRLTKSALKNEYDIVFLWIGVNDVYSKLLKVQAQPVVKGHQEFGDYFTKVLELIIPHATEIIVVSPAIVGENIHSLPNNELRDLSSKIEAISTRHTNVRFLNMQALFAQHLATGQRSDYLSTGVFRVMKDVFLYKSPERIDRLSSKRGLQLTLDGIHLNSKGASIVVEAYATIIDEHLKSV